MNFTMQKLLILSLLLGILIGCTRPIFKSKWVNEKAPEVFIVMMETSKGNFKIQITKEFSPYAASRFYQTIKHHVFDNTIFYRVDSNFVAQFGNLDSIKMKGWDRITIPDEKVIAGNLKGTLSYARSGKETRGNVLFINLKNNSFLDTVNFQNIIGFPVFGKVIQGMDVVESLYSGYGDKPMGNPDLLSDNPKLLKAFPKLDFIKKAYLIKQSKEGIHP